MVTAAKTVGSSTGVKSQYTPPVGTPQSYTLPPGSGNPPIVRDPWGVTQDGVTTWTDGRVEGTPTGGGGVGGIGGAIAPAVPPMTFDNYINGDFGYQQTVGENQRRLSDFDAQTLLQRQQTDSEQQMRRAMLQQTLSEMGGDWGNDAANRGILRSGLYLQGQDKVDQAGVRGNQDIDQLLTQLLAQRQSGRVDVEGQNRSVLNDVLSSLSERFNGQVGIA